MKKTIVILFAIIISSIEVNAQINLEHTFTNINYAIPFSTETQTMYYYMDTTNIYFYNENYTLYKSLSIPIQNGYHIIGVLYTLSTILFNNDNLIEFILIYYKDDNTDVKSIIYNENGSVIESFNNSLAYYAYSTKNNGYRMNVQRYTNYPDEYVTEVYSLPGTLTAMNEFDRSNLVSNPFPNPAKEEIYLPYKLNETETSEMLILDSNGKLVESFKIGGHFNKIRLNTSTYLPGIYIYKFNNISNKFIVQ